MKYCSKFLPSAFILVVSLSWGSCTSGGGELKSASEPVEANKVESTTLVTRTSYVPLSSISCNDPMERDDIRKCPTASSGSRNISCSDLPAFCLQCNFNCTCVYGQQLNVTCKPKPKVICDNRDGNELIKTMQCLYCYQTESYLHSCSGNSKCNSLQTPRSRYSANCTVHPDILCLGRRNFLKKRECNWTAGCHWATALLLSATLGGFGADRFYLGHWQEGIGKLFSFGGLGVWTIMDVILIAIRYLGPADGSLYI